MKIIFSAIVKLFIISSCLILFSCPEPVPPSPPPVNIVGEFEMLPENSPLTPYMVIPDNKIYNTSYTMEYSLNNKGSWSDCGGGVVSVTFAQGNRVYVREKLTPATEWYLGEVKYTVGYPDIYPSSRFALCFYNSSTSLYEEKTGGVPGQQIRLYYKYNNIGNADSDRSFTNTFYLSTDRTITTGDYLLLTMTGTRTLAAGQNPVSDTSYYISTSTLPSLAPGRYYLGCMLDVNSTVTELNDDNNTTPPEMVNEVIVKDPTANSQGGAFKIVNSWGTSGTWEHIHDGHYWVTYAGMKAFNMPVWYYYNTFSVQYKPTVIAVFQLTHAERDKCLIKLGLGDPANPYLVKEFQSRSVGTIFSGALPFPTNAMALDISEFAHAINSSDLFLTVTTSTGTGGTVNSFEVRYYSVYTGSLITTVTGGAGAFAGSTTTNFTAPTNGALSVDYLDDITPPERSVAAQTSFIEELPGADELAADMVSIGVRQPGKNYNKIAYGRYGTGFAPPTADEWRSMYKLRAIQSEIQFSTYANNKIDHSTSQFFPPIGNQGGEGSCACFAAVYYTHTYTMAKEFNWNLTGTSYGGTYPGAPLSNTDKIMSPDFVYHQINSGGDNGSSLAVAFAHLSRMGGATWSLMPYNQSDSTTWPSLNAFLEAAKYRGREVHRMNDYLHYGYFVIRDDSDINLLKNMLMNGYVVTAAIQASNPGGLYSYLDANDVVDITSAPVPDIDHAQTIVGFKDGTMWSKTTPDD